MLNPEEVREGLKNLRNIYTQKEIAEKLDVAPNTIRRWEQGEATPKKQNNHKLENLLLVNKNKLKKSETTEIDKNPVDFFWKK